MNNEKKGNLQQYCVYKLVMLLMSPSQSNVFTQSTTRSIHARGILAIREIKLLFNPLAYTTEYSDSCHNHRCVKQRSVGLGYFPLLYLFKSSRKSDSSEEGIQVIQLYILVDSNSLQCQIRSSVLRAIPKIKH